MFHSLPRQTRSTTTFGDRRRHSQSTVASDDTAADSESESPVNRESAVIVNPSITSVQAGGSHGAVQPQMVTITKAKGIIVHIPKLNQQVAGKKHSGRAIRPSSSSDKGAYGTFRNAHVLSSQSSVSSSPTLNGIIDAYIGGSHYSGNSLMKPNSAKEGWNVRFDHDSVPVEKKRLNAIAIFQLLPQGTQTKLMGLARDGYIDCVKQAQRHSTVSVFIMVTAYNSAFKQMFFPQEVSLDELPSQDSAAESKKYINEIKDYLGKYGLEIIDGFLPHDQSSEQWVQDRLSDQHLRDSVEKYYAAPRKQFKQGNTDSLNQMTNQRNDDSNRHKKRGTNRRNIFNWWH